MLELIRDFRFAFRALLRNPGVTLAAIFALGLGLGANSANFTTVNSLVLHPLPYPHLERIMTLWETIPNMKSERASVAPANFLDWKEQSRSFEHLAAFRPWDATLTGQGDPERLQACQVDPSFFSLLGMSPALGRTFRNEETDPAHAGVVVVSHGFWERRMASDRGAIGSKLSLGGRTYTVVGVMPDEFDFPLETELWAPLAMTGEQKNQRGVHNLAALGLLKPGVSPSQARVELETIASRLERQFPQTNEGRTAAVVPIRELTNNVTDRFVLALLGAAGFVLLLACANVANLMLSRAAGRQKELAIRTALGASRFRIARALIAESLVVSLAGGILALFLASWNAALTRSTVPAFVFRWVAGLKRMQVDADVMLFTFALAIVTGLICGLPAAIRMARGTDVSEALKETGRGSSAGRARSRFRNALVVSEVALALILLIGAGVMVKTFQRLLQLDCGFDPKNLLVMDMALPVSEYRDPAQIASFYDRSLRGLETIPDVRAASVSGSAGVADRLTIEGRPEPRPGEPRPEIRAVGNHYFEAMALPVRMGRPVSLQDGVETQRVVVLSESVANHYWPKGDGVGRRIRLGNGKAEWLTVIGVAGDIKDWFTGRPMPQAYIPYPQAPRLSMRFAIRTAGDPLAIVKAARDQIRRVDPNQPLYDVKSMDQVIADQTSGVRASAVSMTIYAVLALALAVTGIYAVVSYSVTQRTHEIGVRMALGARASDVLGMTLRQAMSLAGMGLAIGVPVAFVLMRLLSSVLYNVVTVEVTTFVAFIVVLAASAMLASYLPARRAASVDPLVALRHE